MENIWFKLEKHFLFLTFAVLLFFVLYFLFGMAIFSRLVFVYAVLICIGSIFLAILDIMMVWNYRRKKVKITWSLSGRTYHAAILIFVISLLSFNNSKSFHASWMYLSLDNSNGMILFSLFMFIGMFYISFVCIEIWIRSVRSLLSGGKIAQKGEDIKGG